MKLTTYIRKNLHKDHPLLRLNKPFLEPSQKEIEKILAVLDTKEALQEPLNALERIGFDLLLSSVGVDTDNRESLKNLQEYLAKN